MKYLFNSGVQKVNAEAAFAFRFYYSESSDAINNFRRSVI